MSFRHPPHPKPLMGVEIYEVTAPARRGEQVEIRIGDRWWRGRVCVVGDNAPIHINATIEERGAACPHCHRPT